MVSYKCHRCNKVFNRKSNYEYHVNRKNPCKINDCKIIQDDCKNFAKQHHKIVHMVSNSRNDELQNIKCTYCDKIFKHKCNLSVHVKNRCKIKKQIENERESIYKELLCELQEIKETNFRIINENTKLRNTILKMKHNTINVHNTNNGVVTYNNTIKLVAYGKEDMTKLKQRDIINALQGYGTEVALTKLIHFNDKLPEYHNVYINNMKDKYAMIYDGNKWILKLKTNIIDNIYDTNKEYVEENLDEFVKSLNRSQINALNRWLATDETDEKILRIKDEIKMLLYNEKEIAIKNNNIPLLCE